MSEEVKKPVPFKELDSRLKRGYLSLMIFLAVLSITLITKPSIPIQTILISLALIVMIIGNAKIQDLLAGVILHPIMAMIAGFLAAGAMDLAGGFDALLHALNILAGIELGGFVILGFMGVAVILANIPTIMPMPCGRILAVALLPGVVKYGNRMIDVASASGSMWGGIPAEVILPALMGAFIVNAAASCGPSPLGGVGGIGEGNLGVKIGSSGLAQQAGIMMATGLTAVIISFIVSATYL
ncbi:MAG: hypothetical protein SVM80_11530 [Halobacteriota archaeon]|nr:hypothetical protein [Halobacteriota archaeon]